MPLLGSGLSLYPHAGEAPHRFPRRREVLPAGTRRGPARPRSRAPHDRVARPRGCRNTPANRTERTGGDADRICPPAPRSSRSHRRHLNESQRAMVANNVANLKRGGDGGIHAADRTNAQTCALPRAYTQEEAARELNVGRRTRSTGTTVNHASDRDSWATTGYDPGEVGGSHQRAAPCEAVAALVASGSPTGELAPEVGDVERGVGRLAPRPRGLPRRGAYLSPWTDRAVPGGELTEVGEPRPLAGALRVLRCLAMPSQRVLVNAERLRRSTPRRDRARFHFGPHLAQGGYAARSARVTSLRPRTLHSAASVVRCPYRSVSTSATSTARVA